MQVGTIVSRKQRRTKFTLRIPDFVCCAKDGPRMTELSHYRKIAVLNANGISDFVFSLPALNALRSAIPHADIVLLAKAWHEQFLRGRKQPIDRVVVVPPYVGVGEINPGKEDPNQIKQFFAAMGEEEFDVAIQLHDGGLHSNPFVKRLAANLTVGTKSPDAVPLDRWVPYVGIQSQIMRAFEVLALLNVQPKQLEPRIMLTHADRREIGPFISDISGPLIVMHPGARDPRQRWPAEKFAQVADGLAADGASVALNGVAEERDIIAAVLSHMHAPAINLCGRLSLGGLAGLMSQAAVVVSNDSGPLHLATAVGASTVGIFWCGNLINNMPINRTRHRPAVGWRLNCPRCGRNTQTENCNHQESLVADVSVEEVLHSARDLLAQSATPWGLH